MIEFRIGDRVIETTHGKGTISKIDVFYDEVNDYGVEIIFDRIGIRCYSYGYIERRDNLKLDRASVLNEIERLLDD